MAASTESPDPTGIPLLRLQRKRAGDGLPFDRILVTVARKERRRWVKRFEALACAAPLPSVSKARSGVSSTAIAAGAGRRPALPTWPTSSFQWASSLGAGREQGQTLRAADAKYWSTAFCTDCGSAMPWLTRNGKVMVVGAGGLDDDPGLHPRSASSLARGRPGTCTSPISKCTRRFRNPRLVSRSVLGGGCHDSGSVCGLLALALACGSSSGPAPIDPLATEYCVDAPAPS